MKRNYSTGESTGITYFVGIEVEKTPAEGLHTLFVTGLQPVHEVQQHLTCHQAQHIFFGANHSFHPTSADEWKAWEDMIQHFLDRNILCSLDIPMAAVEEFHESGLCESDLFIPQIRVPIPYIKLWNYNTMLKIDDKGFNETNPGVWCHSLHDLNDRKTFTPWTAYAADVVIK